MYVSTVCYILRLFRLEGSYDLALSIFDKLSIMTSCHTLALSQESAVTKKAVSQRIAAAIPTYNPLYSVLTVCVCFPGKPSCVLGRYWNVAGTIVLPFGSFAYQNTVALEGLHGSNSLLVLAQAYLAAMAKVRTCASE